MATNAKPGIGSYVAYWNTVGAGSWDTLAEVTHIGWSGSSRQTIETFVLNNADDYVNKLQGVLNGGDVTFTANYTRDQWILLKALEETRGDTEWQWVLPDGEALEWGGFITELPLEAGSDDVMTGEISIAVNGKPDIVSGATATTPA